MLTVGPAEFSAGGRAARGFQPPGSRGGSGFRALVAWLPESQILNEVNGVPRYLYHCPACLQTFEIEKGMAAAADPALCPQCRQPGRRLFTPPGISRKGEDIGFDNDDSASAETSDSEGCAGCAQNGSCGMNESFED